MKTKTVKAILSIFVAFSFALNSCDKNNTMLVNRRTATPEKIKEIKEAQRAKEREAKAQQKAKEEEEQKKQKLKQKHVVFGSS
ncbi:hypothetical protein AGMMS49950_01260 [Endomicrobiia bacterium]|nr:hypothetical protein AGMMS49531_00250 [Endomicrobiia bacterium]GHT69135.1 hypothetical protein AGMMS49950_01260 [Endomicrobiia bacterium]